MAQKIKLPERYIDELHLVPTLSDEDMKIYFKVMKRVNPYQNLTLEKVIVELEKEIEAYRNRIKNMSNNDNLISFRVDQNTSSNELFKFLCGYVPMGEVLNLYKELKNALELKDERN